MNIAPNLVFARLLRTVLAGLFFAAAVPVPAFAADPDDQPVFYPLPPSEPKLQFLKKFSSALDISTKSKGFRDFVFGGEQNEETWIEKPYGTAIHDGALFIVDARGNGYAVFDLADGRARLVKPSGAGQLLKPINITIDEDGTRYVTDTSRKQVLVFDAGDTFQRAIGDPESFEPIDVAVSGDKLIVTDIMNHQVHFMDKVSGEILKTIGEKGGAPGTFLHPTNIAVGADGSIYVADTNNFRVQQFSADGEFIREAGGMGNRPGKFSRPKGIAVDRDGNIYVTDAAFQNIQVLAAEDAGALMAFGQGGTEPFNINLPTVVKIDYDNVEYFRQYAAPGWEIEYLVIVASQYGPNKVVVFGFGHYSDLQE
jgi:DNA-binding beta-propeller fold protein YncE